MPTGTNSVSIDSNSPAPMDTSRESQASSVLLAEDDSVNRKIAWQILRNLGYHVTVVGTSKEALNAFQRFHFDLVILGCECSGLDGYETASLIRQEESREIHTPIIGLTASTLQSDRKRREAASMDDYIAIPIQPRNVVAVLKRWDKNDKCCSHHKPTAIDRSMIRSIQTIAGEDNPTLLNELIDLFVSGTPKRLQEMEEALRRQSSLDLYRPAHSLKGSSGQMGAVRMQQICSALEALAKADTLKGVAPLIEELNTEFERATQDLQAIQMEKLEGPLEEPDYQEPGISSDLTLIGSAFKGKCILTSGLYPGVLAQLNAVLGQLDCDSRPIELMTMQGVGWEEEAQLLLLGTKVGDTTILEKCIKSREQGRKIPIIVLTGALDSKMLTCIESLEADFVLEPFRIDDLLLRIHQKLNTPSSPTSLRDRKDQSKILVAEDDPLIARFLCNALMGAGYVVTHAEDGDATLSEIQRCSYQLIILDINMPKVDGFGVLSQMRLQREYSDVPVLMLTSRVHEHDVLHAFDLGVDDYVTKPFNPLEVVSRVRRLLKRR